MDIQNVEIDLKDSMCKYCENLVYDDYNHVYICKHWHNPKKPSILYVDVYTVNHCDFFSTRIGDNWDFCDNVENCCLFCSNCKAYQEHHIVKEIAKYSKEDFEKFTDICKFLGAEVIDDGKGRIFVDGKDVNIKELFNFEDKKE